MVLPMFPAVQRAAMEDLRNLSLCAPGSSERELRAIPINSARESGMTRDEPLHPSDIAVLYRVQDILNLNR